MCEKEKHKHLNDDQTNVADNDAFYLMLYNDNVNSFEFVIDSLVKVCKHIYSQAYQCALIAHYNGKCEINVGPREDLKMQKAELIEMGLSITIEKTL